MPHQVDEGLPDRGQGDRVERHREGPDKSRYHLAHHGMFLRALCQRPFEEGAADSGQHHREAFVAMLGQHRQWWTRSGDTDRLFDFIEARKRDTEHAYRAWLEERAGEFLDAKDAWHRARRATLEAEFDAHAGERG